MSWDAVTLHISPTSSMIYSIYKDLEDGEYVSALGYDILIHKRTAGTIDLASGKLVACDPLVHPTTEPFELELPRGEFPVELVIAELRDEARVAYAVIRFKEGRARSWKRLTVEEEDTSMLSSDEQGYTVVSSLGCFMDTRTADRFLDYVEMHHDDDRADLTMALEKLERRALNRGVSFGELVHARLGPRGHVVVFSSGFGEGFYETYVGRDADGEIARVVTDFRVLDHRFPSFGL